MLAPGAAVAVQLGGGGLVARRVTDAMRVTLSGDGLALYVIRSDAAGSSTTAVPASGAEVPAPAAGESVWVVGVNPTPAGVDAELQAG